MAVEISLWWGKGEVPPGPGTLTEVDDGHGDVDEGGPLLLHGVLLLVRLHVLLPELVGEGVRGHGHAVEHQVVVGLGQVVLVLGHLQYE